jgi:cysteine dioxygenase
METINKSLKPSSSGLTTFLNKLKEFTKPISASALKEILATSALSTEDILDWIHFDPNLYARNKVATFPHVEVLALCWLPGQITPIHNHKNSACAVKVLEGVGSEISYERTNSQMLVPANISHFSRGEVVCSYDEDMHQMGNFQGIGQNLVTLHCYSPPLQRFEIFDSPSAYFHDYSGLVTKVAARLQQNNTAVLASTSAV